MENVSVQIWTVVSSHLQEQKLLCIFKDAMILIFYYYKLKIAT